MPWLALVGLTLYSLGWDLWAVFSDQAISSSDSYTSDSLWLWEQLQGINEAGWEGLVNPKGSVATALGFVLLLVVGQVPQATRLVSVLAHGALIFQTHDLGRRLGGGHAAGLWSALLCASCPMVYGWCRLDYREPLLAVAVLGGLQLMLRLDLRRTLPVLLLGLVLALGVMTKPSYVVFMCVPGVWFLLRRLRGVGAGARVLLMLVVMGAALAPWLRHVGPELLFVYPRMATSEPGSELYDKAVYYFALPGVLPLLALALVASAGLLLWARKQRWEVTLLAGTVALSMVLFLTLFDKWSRYIVPLLPPAAVLSGVAAARVQARLPVLWRRVGAGAVAAVLLALMALLSLRGLESNREDREHGAGLLAPDPRPRNGYARAMARLRTVGPQVLVVHDSLVAFSAAVHFKEIGRFRGVTNEIIELDEARRLLAGGRPLPVLLVRRHPDVPLKPAPLRKLWPRRQEWEDDANLPRLADPLFWLARQGPRRRCMLWITDPEGTRYGACVVRRP